MQRKVYENQNALFHYLMKYRKIIKVSHRFEAPSPRKNFESYEPANAVTDIL